MGRGPAEVRNAFYSAEAASMYGTAIWRSEDGTEIEITFMGDGLPYLYEDAKRLEVTEFIRPGRLPLDIPRTRSYSGLPKPTAIPAQTWTWEEEDTPK